MKIKIVKKGNSKVKTMSICPFMVDVPPGQARSKNAGPRCCRGAEKPIIKAATCLPAPRPGHAAPALRDAPTGRCQ